MAGNLLDKLFEKAQEMAGRANDYGITTEVVEQTAEKVGIVLEPQTEKDNIGT